MFNVCITVYLRSNVRHKSYHGACAASYFHVFVNLRMLNGTFRDLQRKVFRGN